MRALLTGHPDLFPGATIAAALRRVPPPTVMTMRIAAGRLDVESKLALAYESTQTSMQATSRQFANFLAWKVSAEVAAIAIPGSVRFVEELLS